MARAGDELKTTSMEKQRIVLRTTADESNGELLEMEAYYKPGSTYPPEHFHPKQDEHFEVIKGQLQVRLNGKEHTFRAGESFDVPRGTSHTFRNADNVEAAVIWQVRPALKTQQFYETLWGLAGEGKTNKNGIPNLLQLAVILHDYADEFVLTSPPLFVQRLVFAPLMVLGRLLGYRGIYERFSGKQTIPGSDLPLKRHTAQASIWINRAPEDVFDFISNYDNDTQWRKVVSMTQEPIGEMHVGTITREVIDFLGKRYTNVARITHFEPSKRLVWQTTESPFPIAGWRMVESEAGGTRFTELVTADISGAMRIFAPIMIRALRKQMQDEIADLKYLLEVSEFASIPRMHKQRIAAL